MDSNTNKFDDIAPLYDKDVKRTMQEILVDPGFQNAVQYIIPNVDWDEFYKEMSSYGSKHDFQTKIIYQTIWALGGKVTTGLRSENWDKIDKSVEHLFLSNHRDIVLDAGFMNILRHKHGFETTEIAIGDNLLIHPWIDKLVRMNKSFVVRRGLAVREQLTASKHLSEYIHYAITQKKESVWMAQREGRAKDSNDKTQISLLKMVSLYPETGCFINNIKELNIIPLSISYEYDPCDYLKAKEFQLKRDNPEYKKSQRDDLLSMEIGILGYKGGAVFRFGDCINDKVDMVTETDKRIQVGIIADIIDKEIYTNYEVFACNYIAHDMLHDESRFKDKYTKEEADKFKEYLNKQIEKIDLENKDYDFLLTKLLEMYSNTLKNYLAAIS